MRDFTVTSRDGTQLAVRDHGGSGPEVILLHGATRNLADWGPIVAQMRGVRAVAFDQRCHGRSAATTSLDDADLIADVEAVAAGAGLDNPFVGGHSFGGLNAVRYGLAHPGCPGVLDIDGYDVRQREFYDELEPELVRAFLESFSQVNASFVADGEGDDAWHDQQVAIARQMDAAWGATPEVTEEFVSRAFEHCGDGRWRRKPAGAFWSLVFGGKPVDILGPLREIMCPTVVVACTRPMPIRTADTSDVFAVGKRGLVRHLRSVAADNPCVRVETVEATHGVIYEKPDLIASMIESLVGS